MIAREARLDDAPRVAAIYNEGIEDRIATFETRPRAATDVAAWLDGVHPVVVVEDGGEVVAFASTGAYRSRDCYRRVAEFSVYVARGHRRRGAGRVALEALVRAAQKAGLWKLVSRIFAENIASRWLCQSCGFREVGIYERHGELDGVWRDCVIVERMLPADVDGGPRTTPATVTIETLTAADAHVVRAELMAILEDAVDGGASVGFLPPLARAENAAYWQTVFAAVEAGTRVLLVAREPGGRVVGTVQLDLATRPNARHRAEVMKVMVHRRARRRGIGRALMLAVEEHARRLGRTTLVLDTRRGDPSETLYVSVGWRLAGIIPGYARSADGGLDPSAFYYRLLEGGST